MGNSPFKSTARLRVSYKLKTVTSHLSKTEMDHDAIIVGAGISGLYQLYKLRNLGLNVKVFEAGNGVGGTWYWNRYPGARFDSESYSYAYSFSQELLDEWDWSEHFASQPEILRYLQHVADRFDLIKDIRFSSDGRAALYSDDTRSWQIQLQDGSIYRSRSRTIMFSRETIIS